MSIFRRDSDPSPEPPAPARPARPAPRVQAQTKSAPSGSTHIASGTKVVGEISGAADLVIDGVVEGEIRLESHVVVGTDGRVEGKIQALSVEVGGKVIGNVHGDERIEVLATGRLEGDVMSPRVKIAEGAFFKGKVEMIDKNASRPAASKAKPNAPKPGSPQSSSQKHGGKPQGAPMHGGKAKGMPR